LPSVGELPGREIEQAVSSALRYAHSALNYDYRLGGRDGTHLAVRLDQTFEPSQREYWRERQEADRVAELHAQTAVEIDEFVAAHGVARDRAIWALT